MHARMMLDLTENTNEPLRLGLALGGGAARESPMWGSASLMGEPYPVRAIAGTSAGAMVGAMIASGFTR